MDKAAIKEAVSPHFSRVNNYSAVELVEEIYALQSPRERAADEMFEALEALLEKDYLGYDPTQMYILTGDDRIYSVETVVMQKAYAALAKAKEAHGG